jgi:hypothetical protein
LSPMLCFQPFWFRAVSGANVLGLSAHPQHGAMSDGVSDLCVLPIQAALRGL